MARQPWFEEEKQRRAHLLNKAQHARLKEIASDPNKEVTNSILDSNIADFEPLFSDDQAKLANYGAVAMTLQLFREPRVLTTDELKERLDSSRELAIELLEADGHNTVRDRVTLDAADAWLKRAFRLLEFDVIERRDPEKSKGGR